MSEPYYADEAVTLHPGHCLDVLRALPDNSVDAVVTDPPYGLGNTASGQVAETVKRWMDGERDYLPGGSGFMGKAWDAFVPPVAVWDDCLRVLKPGGHLLAFSGSRTLDLMSLSIRLAGFDIRESIAWLYGSGFPKSHDVTDAMDSHLAGVSASDQEPRQPNPALHRVTRYLREARDTAGWTNRRIDALFGTNGMGGHWTTQQSQPAAPSARQWAILKAELGFGDEMDELIEQLGANERPESDGTGQTGPFLGTLRKGGERATPGGWGTALKPAFEPIVVARKPFPGTVAANVQEHGTGALNIDGCRTPMSDADRQRYVQGAASWAEMSERRGQALPDGSTRKATEVYGDYGNKPSQPHDAGRWPTNVVIDGSQADALDKQSGASRFFPTFRYEAKAPTSERPTYWAHDCDCEHDVPMRPGGSCLTCGTPGTKVAHPTVKPLDLMRWLVRLVTPPGGTVLEPFAGSGTTAEACVIEGFRCIAIEREADYLPLIVARLTKPIQIGLDFGGVA